jgi:predicted nuclease of predicted toxin-antitoxin system
MGFIIDENMPEGIPVSRAVPVAHAAALGSSISDSYIWDVARRDSMVIITKDSDFSDRILLSSPPPWVVRFRVGNMRRARFFDFVAAIWPEVERRLPAHKLVEVYPDRIEAIE